MSELRSLRAFKVALALSTLFGAGLCTNQLFGVHGVESALLLGAVIPVLAAFVACRVVYDARARNLDVAATALLWRGLVSGWLLLAAPVGLLALNALRVRNCTPIEGLLFIALGPLAGTTLASVCGVLAGAFAQRSSLANALALAAPLSTVIAALGWFYATPAIFAYGHFFGFFPGTLYDEALQIPAPLFSLRVITSVFTVALGCLFVGHYDVRAHRLRRAPIGSRLFGVVAMLGIGVVVACEANAVALGHRGSADAIAERLGRTVHGKRCSVVLPRELAADEALRLRDDCDYRVEQMERVIGVTQRARVTAYFFRNPDEKRAMMGAATTYIAKPWRNEVYLQLGGWPHHVLAHEIAHVVAGNIAPGPLHVAARLGGLWPEAALIEGMAVAAAWDADDGMTPHQWARAMVDLKLSPRVRDLLGTGFLGQPKERAYTLAGSFLRFVADTRGSKALRAVYRDGDTRVLGASIDELEQQWLAFIAHVEVPREAMAMAAQRFSRGSIFSNVCPRRVANLRMLAQGDLASNDMQAAMRTCHLILETDASDTWARSSLITALSRAGKISEAEQELAVLIGPPAAAPPVIAGARHLIADAAWRRGDHRRAADAYQGLLDEPQTEDLQRLLEVKALALTLPMQQRDLLFEMLVGSNGVPPDPATTVHLAHTLDEKRGDGLGKYLAARQLFFASRFALAASLMERARGDGLPTQLLDVAALRVEATALFAAGNLDRAEKLWIELLTRDKGRHVLEASDWLSRIGWMRRLDARK